MVEIGRLAFIGAGAMGEAMVRGVIAAGLLPPERIAVSDASGVRRMQMAERHRVVAADSNRTAVIDADVVVLAVKPQNTAEVLAELRRRIGGDQVLLSVAAGITIETLQSRLGHDRIVRAIPNTPAQIGAGVCAWTASPAVDSIGRARAVAVLDGLGTAVEVDHERYLDMATALSGSGPAYVFLFVEALIDAGVHVGLPRPLASQLAIETVIGAGLMARTTEIHPAALRNMVTSPGGTTAAGLAELEGGAVRAAIDRAVWAAYERSQALGVENREQESGR